VKAGTRGLGVAESYRDDESTLAGCVVRADRVVDGLAFSSCTVGGTDATAAVLDIFERLGREDIQHLLVAGVAPAWFNILDLHRLHDATGLPVLSVSFEESTGLTDSIREAFTGEARDRRLETYRAQPPRRPVAVDGERLFVRAVGISDGRADAVVRGFTPEGGRPEPVRVARLAARAGDAFRRLSHRSPDGTAEE
jgi:endonuclease V-like protein UPF0215 family